MDSSSTPIGGGGHSNYGASTTSDTPARHRSAVLFSDYARHESSNRGGGLSRHMSTVSEPASYRGQISQMRDGVSIGLEGYSSSLNILLIFVPISYISAMFVHNATLTFITSFLGMIPLAMLLGKATEDIAEHTNETLGALVNVTFGNAVELILSISALSAGKMELIRDTIAGSILSNLLLVLGSAFFFGGLRHFEQVVLPAVSEANADLLSFAVFGLSIPALYSTAFTAEMHQTQPDELVSLFTSVGLLCIYAMYIFFQLYTHAELYHGSADNVDPMASGDVEDGMFQGQDSSNIGGRGDGSETHEQVASLPVAIGILTWMVFLVAVSSEFLVGSIDEFSKSMHLGERFIAVILLPVVGNAVEHMSAILVARHNKIDLSIGIACGSSVQIALFAAPLLVVLSWIVGAEPLTLNFQLFEILCIGFSVFIVNATMRDSRTNWLEGAVLMVCYFIIAAAFFFMGNN